MRNTKIARAISVGLIGVSAIALAILLNLDWNLAKPWFNARTSEALDRPFTIAGDLSLSWENQRANHTGVDQGWYGIIPWPHFVAQDVRIGNPSKISAIAKTEKSASTLPSSDMATIKQITFSLNPWALLGKKLSIPVLSFDSPVINLERDDKGNNNWTFKNNDKPSPWQLELQSLNLTGGSIHLVDAIKHADVTAKVETLNGDPVYGIGWALQGKLNKADISGKGKAGAVLALYHQTVPYPFVVHINAGQTAIEVDGTLTSSTEQAALDMRLKLSGVSMAHLYSLSGLLLPETPPYTTEGHLIGTLSPNGGHWVYEDFSGKVGSSDIAGSLDYRSRQPRALLSGTVVSDSLHFADLAPLVGADSNSSKAKRGDVVVQPANKILPVEPFKTQRWTSIDADIKFSAGRIIRNKELPINKLTVNLQLKDGVLSLQPLNFEMAGGNLSSNITLDGSGKAIKAQMKMAARHLQLKQLFPAMQTLKANVGEINGDASLSSVGNSIASLLGASNGEIKALVDQGTVSKLLLEEMGLNIGNVIITQLVGDKQVKLNCMAADFAVTNGMAQTRNFMIDTDDAISTIDGNISLAQEQLDLTIKTNSKRLRVFSLRAPIYVKGSFQNPRISVNKGVLALKTGGAIALSTLAPIAALLPLIKIGPGENSECAKLLANARITPVAPPPEKSSAAKTHHKKTEPNAR